MTDRSSNAILSRERRYDPQRPDRSHNSLSYISTAIFIETVLDRFSVFSNFTVTFFFTFPFFLSFFLSSNYETRVHARKYTHIRERRLGHWVIVVRCYRVRQRRRDGAAPPHCTTLPGGAATLPPFPFSYTPLAEISTPGAREQRQPLPKRETRFDRGRL